MFFIYARSVIWRILSVEFNWSNWGFIRLVFLYAYKKIVLVTLVSADFRPCSKWRRCLSTSGWRWWSSPSRWCCWTRCSSSSRARSRTVRSTLRLTGSTACTGLCSCGPFSSASSSTGPYKERVACLLCRVLPTSPFVHNLIPSKRFLRHTHTQSPNGMRAIG